MVIRLISGHSSSAIWLNLGVQGAGMLVTYPAPLFLRFSQEDKGDGDVPEVADYLWNNHSGIRHINL